MPLLAGKLYDPAVFASKLTSSLIAMTALDTTNLRLTFTAPANGIVQVRLACSVHGATSYPKILLGVMEGSTVRGRMSAIGGIKNTAVATAMVAQEAVFLVTGLTPSASYTFDAAYSVDVLIGATSIKYGGADNTAANDAFGGFVFEIWDTPKLLAGKLYDPSTAASAVIGGAGIAMTAFDTTNLRLTFTAPANGIVMVRVAVAVHGAATFSSVLLGVMEGATVRGRMSGIGGFKGTQVVTERVMQEAVFLVTGLTGGNSYTFDAAYGVETPIAGSNLKWGGPNDTTTDNAFGGFAFEIWDVS